MHYQGYDRIILADKNILLIGAKQSYSASIAILLTEFGASSNVILQVFGGVNPPFGPFTADSSVLLDHSPLPIIP